MGHAALAAAARPGARTGPLEWARRTCDARHARSPVLTDRWHYDVGLVLSGVRERLAQDGRPPLPRLHQGERRPAGRPGRRRSRGTSPSGYILDDVNMGKVLFALHAEAKDAADKERYRRALYALRAQLAAQPRTADGGFWHKQIYPHQMWADGVYMASPFLAKFAAVFGEPAALDDAVKQVLLAETHLRDAKTGLLFHGWDETQDGALGGPGDRAVAAVLGARRRLVRDGGRRRARRDAAAIIRSARPSLGGAAARLRARSRRFKTSRAASGGRCWTRADGRATSRRRRHRRCSFTRLRRETNHGWLDAKTFAPVAARGYAGIGEGVRRRRTTPGGVHVARDLQGRRARR